MIEPTLRSADELRHEIEPLPWGERFARLSQLGKGASPEQRAVIAELTVQLAEIALAEVRPTWGSLPLKEGVLRLPSRKMRAALGRAAKRVRDRFIVSTVAAGGPPLASVVPGTRFAVGLDDRAVEVPLALATARLAEPGAVLDAGSALNLAVVREVVGRPAAHVTHFTLPGVNEPLLPHDEDRFTHVAGDLREMPFPDAAFDRIVCVSTLEHVGMDNSRYGGLTEHAAASATNAVRELIRVLAPAGELLITVPYGRAVDHGWFRVFDQPGLRALLEPAAPHGVTLRFFYYDDGWTEGGVEGPAAALEAGFFPDVVTGIAVARVIRNGDPL